MPAVALLAIVSFSRRVPRGRAAFDRVGNGLAVRQADRGLHVLCANPGRTDNEKIRIRQ